MLDEARTICGLNGLNSDCVQNEGFVSPLKIITCGQKVSSANSMGCHLVRKNDGVSFGKLYLSMVLLFRLRKAAGKQTPDKIQR